MQHTPGPWRWEINKQSKTLALCGGKGGHFDLAIIQPTRWGMSGGTLFIRDQSPDGYNILRKPHERPGWISPMPGREHTAHWCYGVSHPDMRLIEAAPDLLVALQAMLRAVNSNDVGELVKAVAEGAIKKATAP